MPSSRDLPRSYLRGERDPDLKNCQNRLGGSLEEGGLPLFDHRDPYFPLAYGTLRRKCGASLAFKTDIVDV